MAACHKVQNDQRKAVNVLPIRVSCISLATALLLACSPGDPGPRHVVLISVDTLRADRLGAYGYADATTPAIDALASESIRYERAYAHSSSTRPSVASLLTGRLPAAAQAVNNLGRFAPGVPTLATRLRAEGYATAGFVGNWVLRRGSGAESGFDTYTERFVLREANRNFRENPASLLTDQAIAWIDSLDGQQPFFLWVHYQEPHGPYTPPGFAAKDFAAGVSTVLPQSTSQSGRGAIPQYQWLGHGRLAEYLARYDGEIAIADREVGRLVEALQDRRLVDESLVIFVADHGEAFGEEGLYCAHGEGLGPVQVRVPLTLRIPGLTPAVRHDAVRLIDVVPTIMESLDLAVADESPLPGQNLLTDLGDRLLVAQLQKRDGRRWRSVRDGPIELREAEIDSSASRLLTRDGKAVPVEEAPDVIARLGEILEDQAPWIEPSRRTLAEELSKEERDALRALGYVD